MNATMKKIYDNVYKYFNGFVLLKHTVKSE